MKKVFLFALLVLFSLSLVSCNNDRMIYEYKMIIPTGTPTLALGNFIEQENAKVDGLIVKSDIVSGSDLLVAAFTQGEYDIIVAPLNLGVKFYNQVEDFNYVLYKPIVGCNYYILSTEVLSFTDLDGAQLASFGKNSTPGVVLSTLSSFYNVNPDVTYYDAVTDVNPLLVSGKASNILTAEPSKTVISQGKDYHVIDLGALWKEMANTEFDIPQAAIFVKKTIADGQNIKNILNDMEKSLKLASTNPEALAQSAINVDENFSKQKVEILKKAIPNCNILSKELNKEEVKFYLEKIIELGLGASIGGKLPDEDFYY